MLETATPVKKDYFVHESSYVDEPTEIGSGTSIWHFSHILKDCKLGHDCKIGQNVVIGPNVIIGNNVKIQNNVSIYSGVTVEDDVFCGPSMVFTNVFIPRSTIPRNTEADFLKTLIKKGASIGANATIVCGNTVGRYALVGAGSVVTKDVLDHALVYGNPARQHGWACYCGAPMGKSNRGELKTADTITCSECQREYQRSESGLTLVDTQ